MNSPFARTLVMGALAAVTSIAAAYYFPWPETVVESATVGKPLFESYETSSVRTMRIMQYNDDKGIVDRIQVRRKGEKWVIPSKKEFIATNVDQYTASANCLNERTVLEERTENQEDHVKYGVIDPADLNATTNLSALGTKIILEDRQGRSVASLIVGKNVEKDPRETKRFVRIPGQPTVYVCEFDSRALLTDFRAWVDPNLFEIGGQKINRIQVENYRLNPEPPYQMTQQLYRAMLNVGRQKLNLLGIETASAMGNWQPASMSPEIANQFQILGNQLVNVQFSDVQRKKSAAAILLENPVKEDDAAALDGLKPFGFSKTGFKNGSFEFNGSCGEVKVETEDGVLVSLYIGNIAEGADSSELQLSHFVMLTAGVNEKAIKTPERPKDGIDPQQAEKEKKEYLRAIEKRNAQLKSAQIRATDLNQRFADWIYIVPERVINNLRPDVVLPKPRAGTPSLLDALNNSVKVNTPEKTKADPKSEESKEEKSKEPESATDETSVGDSQSEKPAEEAKEKNLEPESESNEEKKDSDSKIEN